MTDIERTPQEIRHPDGWIEHPSVKREKTDVSTGWIIAVLVICACIGAGDFFVVWRFFRHNEHKQAQVKASTYPLAPPPSLEQRPNEPRLDPLNRMFGNEQADVFQNESANLQRLNEVGPAAEKGFVRIPIQVAIKLVIPQLPVRKPPDRAASKDDGLRFGGGPNSGRIFQEAAP